MKTHTNSFKQLANRLHLHRSLIFGAIIMTALFAFEAFNYGTTHFALTDLLGDLTFAGLSWATILAIAFCGIDFAGIARLFAPEARQERSDGWYLFGAWMLAATMNAMLTWWGVSLAILNHTSGGTAVIGRDTLLRAVPVFVAIMVWLIRVLMIGTISISGDRLFASTGESVRATPRTTTLQPQSAYRPVNYSNLPKTNSGRINEISNGSSRNTQVQPAMAQSKAYSAPRTRTFSNAGGVNSSPPEPELPMDSVPAIDSAYIPAPLAAKTYNTNGNSPVVDRSNPRTSTKKRTF
jgi:hypothetical protein